MKKILFVILLSIFLFIPSHKLYSLVDKEEYEHMNLEESLKDEEIEKEFTNYSETSDQVTIYLFRGKGCSYCKSFLTYINSIVEEYGKYFKLVSFEVWYDNNNAELMDEVADFLDEPAGGVPYIVIGDEVFPGYSDRYNESIINAIIESYENKEKYDVFEEMNKTTKENKNTSSVSVIIWNFLFVTSSTVIILLFINSK